MSFNLPACLAACSMIRRQDLASKAARALVGWLRQHGTDNVVAHIHPNISSCSSSSCAARSSTARRWAQRVGRWSPRIQAATSGAIRNNVLACHWLAIAIAEQNRFTPGAANGNRIHGHERSERPVASVHECGDPRRGDYSKEHRQRKAASNREGKRRASKGKRRASSITRARVQSRTGAGAEMAVPSFEWL